MGGQVLYCDVSAFIYFNQMLTLHIYIYIYNIYISLTFNPYLTLPIIIAVANIYVNIIIVNYKIYVTGIYLMYIYIIQLPRYRQDNIYYIPIYYITICFLFDFFNCFHPLYVIVYC